MATILFDIDNTLLSGRKLKIELCKIFCKELNITNSKYYQIRYDEYEDKLKSLVEVNPRDLIAVFLARFPKADKKYLESVYFEKEAIYKEGIYADVHKVLAKLSHNHKLGIYSEGVAEYQLTKIEKMGLLPYLDKKLIVIKKSKRDTQTIAGLPAKSYIIDDRLPIIEELARRADLKPVLIDRKHQFNGVGVTKINTLNQLIGLVDND